MTRQQVLGMLHDFSTAMMITRAPSGPLDCRPMHVTHIDETGPLWFFASGESRKVNEIQHNAEVLLVLQREPGQHAAVWGRARVVDDPERVERFWKDAYRAWLPAGVTDPDLVLIAVEPHTAEFWEGTGGARLRYVFEPAETYSDGRRSPTPADDDTRPHTTR